MCNGEGHYSARRSRENNQTSDQREADETGFIKSALDYLRGVLCKDGDSYWKADTLRQKAHLEEWANNLGLLLNSDDFLSHFVRGGQEHDILVSENSNRVIKATRCGYFGLTPGIELALVSTSQDARRLHLWEASPYEYLERLYLHNLLIPKINTLEGITIQDTELIIITSQPKFEQIAVTEEEIDLYFLSLGFKKIATASYYREEDNLGIFDAHDKNILGTRNSPETLIPFDIIPCRPMEGFLRFIHESLKSGATLTLDKTSYTSDRSTL